MMTFEDDAGRTWVATAREEDTPRHHGRWYLVLHPEGDDAAPLPLLDVRWQTEASAARTLRTMSVFELRRRLRLAAGRASALGAAAALGAGNAGAIAASGSLSAAALATGAAVGDADVAADDAG
jgi:hypothetical protein